MKNDMEFHIRCLKGIDKFPSDNPEICIGPGDILKDSLIGSEIEPKLLGEYNKQESRCKQVHRQFYLIVQNNIPLLLVNEMINIFYDTTHRTVSYDWEVVKLPLMKIEDVCIEK